MLAIKSIKKTLGGSMSQADRDAEKWLEMHQRHQERELYKAKESGELHHINQYGDVVTEKTKEEL